MLPYGQVFTIGLPNSGLSQTIDDHLRSSIINIYKDTHHPVHEYLHKHKFQAAREPTKQRTAVGKNRF